MNQEVLGRLLIILSVSIVLAIEIKRKTVKRPHFYWAIACAAIALLSVLLTKSESVYLIVCGAFLNLIFGLLFIRILIAGTTHGKRPLRDDNTPKNNESLTRYRWTARLRALSHKYPRAMKVLAGLSVGSTPAFFILILAIVIFGTMLDPSRDFVRPELGAAAPAFFGDLTRNAVVRLYAVFGILTQVRQVEKFSRDF
jgi:hypothetical protein